MHACFPDNRFFVRLRHLPRRALPLLAPGGRHHRRAHLRRRGWLFRQMGWYLVIALVFRCSRVACAVLSAPGVLICEIDGGVVTHKGSNGQMDAESVNLTHGAAHVTLPYQASSRRQIWACML